LSKNPQFIEFSNIEIYAFLSRFTHKSGNLQSIKAHFTSLLMLKCSKTTAVPVHVNVHNARFFEKK